MTARILTSAAEAELERLWSSTALPPAEIERLMGEKFGIKIDAQEHAKARGFIRSGSVHPAAVAERLALRSLARKRPADNLVRKPEHRFPVPNGGFRLGGGT